MSPEARKEARLKNELPILDQFFAWAKTLKPLGGSKLETAVNYTINHEEHFRNYLKDGRIALSNNRALSEGITYPNFFPGSPSDNGFLRKMCA